LSPGSFDPLVRHATRLRLQQFFDLLTVFRPVQVVCHTGYDSRHYRDRRTRYLENSIATWEPLVEQAERFETPLLIENVWEHDPEFHQELLSALPSPCFGFCLDVGHQHSFSTTSLDTWLRTLGDRLMEIHLHDNDGSHDYHLPIGFGTIDFDRLFAFLLENQKKPVLTLEPHTKEHLFQSLEGLDKVLPPSLRSS
jgi:sugar phosphate isomerase/epimerase